MVWVTVSVPGAISGSRAGATDTGVGACGCPSPRPSPRRPSRFASARGWGQVYFYGNDEATGSLFDAQLTAFRTIHANGGK